MKTYAEEVAALMYEGAVLTKARANLCRLALAEYDANMARRRWRKWYMLAIVALALAPSPVSWLNEPVTAIAASILGGG